MANFVVLVLVFIMTGFAVCFVLRRRRSLVSRRGLSIGADLGALADKPRVRVQAVTMTGPDRVHLVLTPETDSTDLSQLAAATDLDLVVTLREQDFGFAVLQEWKRSASSLAIVIPPDSRLVRLRSIDNQQPLTLRRVDDGDER